ncbi:hypothetical protein niasHS_012477 [Heterodera schachtii]|uniref:Uncharacterized protein n=1 Tax=Heterodera schachtii TaxID=97005 RepID=A0ABD2ICE0_HETSC
MKFFVILSLFLQHTCAYHVRTLSSSLKPFTTLSIAKKDDRLVSWSRTELSELANIISEKLLNDPNFANTAFIEQSATKYYLDADSLDAVFKQLESDGVALRTRLYEEIKRAGLLEDKGDIKEVLRIWPIFKEMSQRERDNLRITDQKVIQKIRLQNLVKDNKLSSTPKRLKTFGIFKENNSYKVHENELENNSILWTSRKITANGANEQSKIEQKYLKKKQNAKNYKEKSQRLEKELRERDVEISNLKRSEVRYKMKSEQLEKELAKKEKQIDEIKKNVQKELGNKESVKIYKENSQKLEKELGQRETEIYELKRNEVRHIVKSEHLEKELEKKEKQMEQLKKEVEKELQKKEKEIVKLKKEVGRGGGGENKTNDRGEGNRAKTIDSKLTVKERELYNLDRNISMKVRQLQNFESLIDQQNKSINSADFRNNTVNGSKKVHFADINSVLNQKIEQKFKNAKNDESAEEADDEAVVIKAPRQNRTLNNSKGIKSPVPNYDADTDSKFEPLLRNYNTNDMQNKHHILHVGSSKIKADASAEEEEIETKVLKTPRRIKTLYTRKRTNNLFPNYEADTESKIQPLLHSYNIQNKPYSQHDGALKLKNDYSAEEEEIETKVLKTPRRIFTLNKRSKTNANPVPNYEADVEAEVTGRKRMKTTAHKKAQSVKTTAKGNNSKIAVEILSPSWAHKATEKKNN